MTINSIVVIASSAGSDFYKISGTLEEEQESDYELTRNVTPFEAIAVSTYLVLLFRKLSHMFLHCGHDRLGALLFPRGSWREKTIDFLCFLMLVASGGLIPSCGLALFRWHGFMAWLHGSCSA